MVATRIGIAQVGIERRQRLVQQQKIGIRCQGTGKGYPLLLSSGKLIAIAILERHEV